MRPDDEPGTSHLPDFVVIGGMKCGTTALHRYLRSHPEIFVPRKNIEFFNDEGWKYGVSWYNRFFSAQSAAGKVKGEVATEYAKYPFNRNSAARMAEIIPNAKIIYLVRNPIDRIVSQYIHLIDQVAEHRALDDAALDARYLAYSCYFMQLSKYLEHFSKDSILILASEGLKADPSKTMETVFRFLGVDPNSPIKEITANSREEKKRWNLVGRYVKRDKKRFSHYQYYKKMLPKFAADFSDRMLCSNIEAPSLSPRIKVQIKAALEDDTKAFYEFVGKNFTRWTY